VRRFLSRRALGVKRPRDCCELVIFIHGVSSHDGVTSRTPMGAGDVSRNITLVTLAPAVGFML
jgi:hypothetical protein